MVMMMILIEKTSTSPQQKNKEKLKTEEEEEGDECCICLENLQKDPAKCVRWTCCGQGMHKHCCEDLDNMKMGGTCPLCRAKRASSPEEHFKYLRPWVKKKKAWAQNVMGQMYKNGTGVKQSYKVARRLYEQAAQQGYASAIKMMTTQEGEGERNEPKQEKKKEKDCRINIYVMCTGTHVYDVQS